MKSDNGAPLLRPPSGSVKIPSESLKPRAVVGLLELAVLAEDGPLAVAGRASDRDLVSAVDDASISEALCGNVCPC